MRARAVEISAKGRIDILDGDTSVCVRLEKSHGRGPLTESGDRLLIMY
jgi:hypothetical protein